MDINVREKFLAYYFKEDQISVLARRYDITFKDSSFKTGRVLYWTEDRGRFMYAVSVDGEAQIVFDYEIEILEVNADLSKMMSWI